MSTFVKHEAKPVKQVKLAWIIGAVWAVLLAVIWISYRNSDGTGGGFFNFIGRFHILIVHFPIGIIFLGLIMHVLAGLSAFSHLRNAVPLVCWLGFLMSVKATVVGYLLMSVEDFGGRAMDMHMYFGLAVVVFSFLALIASLKNKGILTGIMLFIATTMTAASGHFGGAMVHKEDYLTEHAPEALKPLLLVGLSQNEDPAVEGIASTEKEDDEAAVIPLGERVVYTDFVVPILEKTCNECHNENKIKGKLRMDTHDLLLAGADGSDFPTIIPGNAEESELIVRVTLEPDHDEFMPPKGDGFTEEEIKLLSLWIEAGAKTETTVAELGDDPSIEPMVLAVAAIHSAEEGGEEVVEDAIAGYQSIWDSLSPEEQDARMEEVMEAANKYRFSVMPISAEDDRLRINVINASKEFGDEQTKLLEPIADRILWLDLARSQVTDESMKTVGKMNGLQRLHLENTNVGDSGIAQLGNLKQLEYLNLYGTKVGNGVLDTFAKLPNLKKIYLWQTNVDPGAAKAFERSVNLEINTGVSLAAAAPATPAEEPKPEAKPEPKKEPAPAPKPAPKAEPKKETPPTPKPETKPKGAPKKETPPAPKPAPKPEPKKETPPAPKTVAKPKPATPAPAKTEVKKATPAPKPAAKTTPAPKQETKAPAPAKTPTPDPKPAAEQKKP